MMSGSRALDAWIAENIFGYKRVCRPSHGHGKYALFNPDHFECAGYVEAGPDAVLYPDGLRFVPRFSSDISAAWSVVEKLREGFYDLDMMICHRGQRPWCSFVRFCPSRAEGECCVKNTVHCQELPSFEINVPLAICLAAYKARTGSEWKEPTE